MCIGQFHLQIIFFSLFLIPKFLRSQVLAITIEPKFWDVHAGYEHECVTLLRTSVMERQCFIL
jgi:hypothetical protein